MNTGARCLHSTVRAQQRGIPRLIEQWLDQFGAEEYDGKGALVRYFSRSSIRQMEREFGAAPIRKLSEYLDAYKVEDSCTGEPITVGHRFRRVNRK